MRDDASTGSDGGNRSGCGKVVLKGNWKGDEDFILKRVEDMTEAKNWTTIAEQFNMEMGRGPHSGRTGKQCRERWIHHLRPDIKTGTWSLEEDIIIIEAHKKFGNRWRDIAKLLVGRTETSVKNHWNSTLRQKITNLDQMSALKRYIAGLDSVQGVRGLGGALTGGWVDEDPYGDGSWLGNLGRRGSSRVRKRRTPDTEDGDDLERDEGEDELDQEMEAGVKETVSWKDPASLDVAGLLARGVCNTALPPLSAAATACLSPAYYLSQSLDVDPGSAGALLEAALKGTCGPGLPMPGSTLNRGEHLNKYKCPRRDGDWSRGGADSLTGDMDSTPMAQLSAIIQACQMPPSAVNTNAMVSSRGGFDPNSPNALLALLSLQQEQQAVQQQQLLFQRHSLGSTTATLQAMLMQQHQESQLLLSLLAQQHAVTQRRVKDEGQALSSDHKGSLVSNESGDHDQDNSHATVHSEGEEKGSERGKHRSPSPIDVAGHSSLASKHYHHHQAALSVFVKKEDTPSTGGHPPRGQRDLKDETHVDGRVPSASCQRTMSPECEPPLRAPSAQTSWGSQLSASHGDQGRNRVPRQEGADSGRALDTPLRWGGKSESPAPESSAPARAARDSLSRALSSHLATSGMDPVLFRPSGEPTAGQVSNPLLAALMTSPLIAAISASGGVAAAQAPPLAPELGVDPLLLHQVLTNCEGSHLSKRLKSELQASVAAPLSSMELESSFLPGAHSASLRGFTDVLQAARRGDHPMGGDLHPWLLPGGANPPGVACSKHIVIAPPSNNPLGVGVAPPQGLLRHDSSSSRRGSGGRPGAGSSIRSDSVPPQLRVVLDHGLGWGPHDLDGTMSQRRLTRRQRSDGMAWGEEEERTLVAAHKLVGNKWSEIAKLLRGRNENSVKNHWNTALRRKHPARYEDMRVSMLDKYQAEMDFKQFKGSAAPPLDMRVSMLDKYQAEMDFKQFKDSAAEELLADAEDDLLAAADSMMGLCSALPVDLVRTKGGAAPLPLMGSGADPKKQKHGGCKEFEE
eukprot:gene7348-469_t